MKTRAHPGRGRGLLTLLLAVLVFGRATLAGEPQAPASESLAGLAFLANGFKPGEGEYGAVIDRAMDYVKAGMDPNGYLGAHYGNGMYMHAMCTLFGLSYLGQAREPERETALADWCRKSVDLILEAQAIKKVPPERGGWRYTPHTEESDLSVTSWQLLVLHAARQCGYEIDPVVFQNALRYVDRAFVEHETGTGFLYRRTSDRPERAVTGVALFIKHLFEPETDRKSEAALRFIQQSPPTWGGPQYNGYFFFGTFYMTQGMFQIGDQAWADFAPRRPCHPAGWIRGTRPSA